MATTQRRTSVGARALLAGVLTLSTVGAGFVVFDGGAQAEPRKTIAQVESEVRQLQSDAEAATEDYLGASEKLAGINRKLVSLRARVASTQAKLDVVSESLAAIAASTYRNGGIDPSLQLLLAADPQAYLSQAAVLDQVAAGQSAVLRRTQALRLDLAQASTSLSQQEQAASDVKAEMRDHKATADSKLAAARSVLGSLRADERARLAAAAQARRQASIRASRARAASVRSSDSGNNSGGGGGGGGGNSPVYDGPASGRASVAVRYALAQVGDRYVAARSGPNSFDCSGLTLAAWRAAGVSLPHYSRSQWGSTRRISRSDVRPGDLLFYFGGGAHHVTIYVGGGMMVSASNPSDGVELIAAWGPWYGSRYSGAGRVVG